MRVFGSGVFLGYRDSVSKNTGKAVTYVDIRDGGYTYNFRCNCPDRVRSIPEYSKVAVTLDVGLYDNRPFLNIADIELAGK